MSPQRFFRIFLAGMAALLLAASAASAQVRVGSKNFTEQFIVAEIYAQALPLAHRIEVTEIDRDYAGDAYAPALGSNWFASARQDHIDDSGLRYAFVTYHPNPH